MKEPALNANNEENHPPLQCLKMIVLFSSVMEDGKVANNSRKNRTHQQIGASYELSLIFGV